MMPSRRGLIPAVALAMLSACSSSSAPPASLQTVEDFCAAWADEACNPSVLDACGADDVGSCAEQQATACQARLPEAGYDSTHAQECIDAVASAFSDAVLSREEYLVVYELAPPCHRLIVGPAAEGESCVSSHNCDTVAGYACIEVFGAATRRCQIPKSTGGGLACDTPGAVCEPGFHCSAGFCIVRGSEGDACSDDNPCVESSICAQQGDEPTCVAKRAEAESCTEDEECLSSICSEAANGICIDEIRLTVESPFCEDYR